MSETSQLSQANTVAISPGWKIHISLFISGQAISILGSAVVQFAVMWHLTLETKSASVVALYAIFAFIPQALISLFGGALADRVNRKMLIIIPDVIIAGATLVLALLMANGYKDLWIILLVVAIRSVGSGFQSPAVNALIPSIVPEDQLLRFNGIYGTLSNLTGIAAPALGAVIYGLGGIEKTLYVDVVTAIIAIAILFFIPLHAQPPARDEKEQTGVVADLVAGLKYTVHHRFLRWLMGVYTVVVLLIIAPNFLVPLLAAQKFDAQVWHLSAIELAFNLGTVIGGILIATLLAKAHGMRLVFFSSLAFGLAAFALAYSPHVWITISIMCLTGFFVPLYVAPSMTEMQVRTDPKFLGRIMSQANIVFTLGLPTGMVVLGPITEYFGVAPIMLATGIINIAFVAWAFLGTGPGREALAKREELDGNAEEVTN